MASKTETVIIDNLKKADLLKMCEDHGISVSKRATNEQIIKILKSRIADQHDEVSDDGAEDKSTKLTGKQKGRIAQKKIREEKLAAAQEIYADDIEETMHGMDRLFPRTVYRNRTNVHREDPEGSGDEDKKVPDELRELAQSKSDPFYTLTGIVDSSGNTEYITDENGNEIPFVYVKVLYKDTTVRIPSYHIWEDFLDTSKYPPNKINTIWHHREGQRIQFNLLLADDKSSPVRYYGTCRLARRKARCNTWYSMTTDGNWNIKDGDFAEARIVETWSNKVVIELGGAETTIRAKEIAARYLDDASKYPEYQPGQKVYVCVSNIEREKVPVNPVGFSYPVKFRASIRAASENPQIKYYDEYDIGDVTSAFVTNVDTNFQREGRTNDFYCEFKRRPVTIKCTPSTGVIQSGNLPKEGDEVMVRVIKKDDDNHWLYGEIVMKKNIISRNEIAFGVER